MDSAYRRCCGIDVHKKSLSVCVLPPAGGRAMPIRQETFRTFTRDLRRLRAWLKSLRVTDIVLESTGQYWRPVWNLLEDQFPRLLLVNPQHVKALAGRKTDRHDAKWLAERLEQNQLQASFIPSRAIRELRDLTRLRVHWLQDLNRIQNRIGDLCESANIKISSVASDLFGLSGRTMLAGLVTGDRDPGWMADYARGTLRHKKEQLELALEGTFTPHQRQLLSRLLEQMQSLERQLSELTVSIEERAAPYADIIQRLITIPGLDRISAWSLISEIGVDMEAFGDAAHLASWAALCPGNCESGGKRLSGKTRKGNRYVRRLLCQSAWAAARTKDSHLASLYRRIRSRRGEQKALVAVAHQLLVIVFHVIRDGTGYEEPEASPVSEQQKPKLTRRLVERLHQLGFQVTLEAVPLPAPEPMAVAEPKTDPPPPKTRARRRAQPSSTKTTWTRPCQCAERGVVCTHGRVRKRPPKVSDEQPQPDPPTT